MSSLRPREVLAGLLACERKLVPLAHLTDALAAEAHDDARPLAARMRQWVGEEKWADLEGAADRRLAEAASPPQPPGQPTPGPGEPPTRANESVATVPPAVPPPSPTPTPGLSSGCRYDKQDQHDAGGLGVLYLARDTEVNRIVALKEIKEAAADHAEHRARFLFEAEVTGQLEHPGVVPVYGVGTYADGRPFYAMRFIHGQSLEKAVSQFHADDVKGRSPAERSLALRELLTRFVAVCDAIAYAHSRGVIHRDVKPDNVMLGKFGETLVVDWGLAKLIGQTEVAIPEGGQPAASPSGTVTSRVGRLTASRAVLGTPQYMPPEQVGNNDKAGPRSDVYSLGATLYRLLTGKAPVEEDAEARARPMEERIAKILEKVVGGQIVPARQANPRVPRALEAVCKKAMALDPDNRYESATALAQDVKSWLADEQVKAHADSLWARLWRRARRNPSAAAGGVTFLLVSVIGLAFGLLAVNHQKNQAETAREAARKAAAVAKANEKRAEANYDLVERMLDTARSDPATAAAEQKALLARAIRKLPRDTPETEADEARLWASFGRIHLSRNERKEAAEKYQQARDILARSLEREPDHPRYRADMARVLNSLARVKELENDGKGAAYDHEAALAIQEGLTREFPDNLDYQAELAGTRLALALVQRRVKRPLEGMRNLEQARDAYASLLERRKEDLTYRDGLAATLHYLGTIQMQEHKPGARSNLEMARELRLALLRDAPESPKYARDVLRSSNNLGMLQTSAGELRLAWENYCQAMTVQRRLMRSQPDDPEHPQDLARLSNNLGSIQELLGQPFEAFRSYQQAVGLLAPLLAEHPHDATYLFEMASYVRNLGEARRKMGQLPRAEQLLERSCALWRTLLDSGPNTGAEAGLARSRARLGRVQTLLGREADAKASFDEALKTQGKTSESFASRVDLARTNLYLSEFHARFGRPDEAKQRVDEALRLLDEARKADAINPYARQLHEETQAHAVSLAR